MDGLILRGDQIVVPTALRRIMIDRAHEGHLGLVKTMAKDLEKAVLRCDVCAHLGTSNVGNHCSLLQCLTALCNKLARICLR